MSSIFTWSGRDDPEDGAEARRWHHIVNANHQSPDLTLLGFPCDIGVARNKGRTGAHEAPDVLRASLANLAWHGRGHIADAGNIDIILGGDDPLADAQLNLSNTLAGILQTGSKALVLGGGHETAAGSFQGLHHHLKDSGKTIGILNLDAHFDIRLIGENGISSGTPFTQIRQSLQANEQEFHYLVLGIAETGNTKALFERADDWGVNYMLDKEVTQDNLAQVLGTIDNFLSKIDVLYLTIDLDVLPHWQMQAVSAPSARGVDISELETIIEHIGKAAVDWPLSDVVEFNPSLDHNGCAARTAARVIDTLTRAMLK
jgi:formiminoglutamase